MPGSSRPQNSYTRGVLYASSLLAEGRPPSAVAGLLKAHLPELSPRERQSAIATARRMPSGRVDPHFGPPDPRRVPILPGGPEGAERVKYRFTWPGQGVDAEGNEIDLVRENIIDVNPDWTPEQLNEALEKAWKKLAGEYPGENGVPEGKPEIDLIWTYQG